MRLCLRRPDGDPTIARRIVMPGGFKRMAAGLSPVLTRRLGVGLKLGRHSMKRFAVAAFGAAVIASSMAGTAEADTRHARRHEAPPAIGAHALGAYNYYPGWGREPVPVYGVYPGLIYGGAISAPAGR
jgi:hypothetical protein